jgi:hypothetical protein
MPEQVATETLLVSDAELAIVHEFAAKHGVAVEEVPQRGVSPIDLIPVAIIGLPVTVSTVVHLVDQLRGGQVIDLRPHGRQTFYRTTDLMYGHVVVLALDGKVNIEVRPTKFSQSINALAKTVAGLTGADMKKVAAQIEQQLSPDDVKVSTQASTGPDQAPP